MFPLKLYNKETTKTVTQQDFWKNFKLRPTYLNINSLVFESLKKCFIGTFKGVVGKKTNFCYVPNKTLFEKRILTMYITELTNYSKLWKSQSFKSLLYSEPFCLHHTHTTAQM